MKNIASVNFIRDNVEDNEEQLIEFKEKHYPKFQAEGFASQFAFPFAEKICKGRGVDIGCKYVEWSLPNSIPIDIDFNDLYDAYNLPKGKFDYIYSSHCLEHLPNWVTALDYWISKLKDNGVLFLYLPHYSQEYWRPWNNYKHIHILEPHTMNDYLHSKEKFKHIMTTGHDLNNSFYVVAWL